MIQRSFLGVLVVLSLLAATPAAASTPGAVSCLTAHSGAESDVAEIRASVEQAPNASNTVRITYDTRTLDGGFAVVPPDDVRVVATRGFRYHEGDDEYRYTDGANPYIAYRVGVDGASHHYASGDSWVFAPTPTHIDVGVNLQPRPAGVVGDQFLYIGNYTRYTTAVGCHDISLVVAAAGALDAPPRQAVAMLRYAATALDVGHRYDTVTIFATPGTAHPPDMGFADVNEAWVTTSFPERVSGNDTRVILHEYIHTRQAFGGFQLRQMFWFAEGMADYYSYRFMADRGLLAPSLYNQWLVNGSRMHGELTDPDTWADEQVGYSRGGAFLAVLDAKIQHTSNNSLETVVRQINRQGDPETNVALQQRTFVDRVAKVSTNETAAWANTTLSSNRSFAVAQAKLAEQDRSTRWVTMIEQLIAARPWIALLTAFLLGISVMEAVYTLSERTRDE